MMRESAAQFTRAGQPSGCLMMSAATNCTSEDVKELLREVRADNLAALSAAIQRDLDAGLLLPAGTDPLALARYFAAVAQGMSQQARDGVDRAGLEAVAEMAISVWPKA